MHAFMHHSIHKQIKVNECVFRYLVSGTQLVDGQNLRSTEGLAKQEDRPHLATEHAVGVRRLRRAQEALVKCLQQRKKKKKK